MKHTVNTYLAPAADLLEMQSIRVICGSPQAGQNEGIDIEDWNDLIQ